LRQAREINPGITTLISVPTGDRTAIKTVLQAGVFSYINEPFDSEEAVIMVARAINFHERQSHQDLHVRKFRKRDGYNGIVGQSRNMQKLFSMLAKVAEDDQSTVLILGETGTGKELAARAIHAQGNRKQKNFVPVNCAAIPDELLESELFGYVQGAFTGAAKSKIGRIQYAQGGTLFLDEIGDMKPALQSKLLRVLQEREFEPVGSVKPVPADIRVIAATHQDLNKAVAEGRASSALHASCPSSCFAS
jgi:DNA-binding NtrC family response regulator